MESKNSIIIARRHTVFGAVRDVGREYYSRYHKCISFMEAIKKLEQSGQVSEDKNLPNFPREETYLSDEDFEAFLMGLPVSIHKILDDNKKAEIDENISIPYGRDVFAFLYLPHINDGKHRHDYFEVNYVYRGSCIQEIIGDARQMKEGEVCIIAPYTDHNVLVRDDSLIISIIIRKTTFDAIFGSLLTQKDLLAMFFKNTLYERKQAHYILFYTENADYIKSIVQKIVVESYRDDKYASICCNSTVQVMFCTLLRKYSDTILYYGYEKEKSTDFDFSLILAYIQQNYNTVTLKSLAEFFHYSEAYLSILIKKNMKQSFSQVLHSLKMKKAVEYLVNSDLSVEQIALQIGYSSADHFTRSFKKNFKYPPSVYRKNYKNTVVSPVGSIKS